MKYIGNNLTRRNMLVYFDRAEEIDRAIGSADSRKLCSWSKWLLGRAGGCRIVTFIAFIFTFVSLIRAGLIVSRAAEKRPLYVDFNARISKLGARLFHSSLSLFFSAPANLSALTGTDDENRRQFRFLEESQKSGALKP